MVLQYDGQRLDIELGKQVKAQTPLEFGEYPLLQVMHKFC